jgi:hypothetical protein
MDETTSSKTSDSSKTGLTDALREHFSGDAPLGEKVKSFVKAKPWASATLIGVAGLALLNTLRGVRR